MPLKNKLKALIILITIYKIDDNLLIHWLCTQNQHWQINKREIFRYVKSTELGLLVEKNMIFILWMKNGHKYLS